VGDGGGMALVHGKVLRLGSDVNTDVIIPARFMQDWDTLGEHVFEGESPELPGKASASAFVVAGRNFGCGSSREQAVRAIQQAGIQCVIAPTFARIFHRNAVNLALPVLEADVDVADGAELEVDVDAGTIREPATGREWQAPPPAPEIRAIMADGGLIPHLEKRLKREQGNG
jgi:3-isopropylmalate dehydratase small subunit